MTSTNGAAQGTVPVLVVGGGLVGLSAAMFLAWQGVPTVLVERHRGSALHPRAIGYTPRTLELLRAVGLGDAVPQAPADFRLRRIRIESLAGVWHEETAWTEPAADVEADDPLRYSPCSGAAIAQDRMEPILRDRAIASGADIRLGTELLGFEQDGAGVTARLRHRDTGAETTSRAQYLIAADGHASPVREALGITRSGRGHIRTLRSVLFRAPLDEYLARGYQQFNIDQPGLQAFLTTYGDGRWVLMFSDDEARDEATLLDLVQRTIGRNDLPIELITTGRWHMSAWVADKFSRGRVFLAGDAAHTLPPSRGGYGANTGIEDAHNLAWKLAAVLKGESGPALLDSYDAERRPIALLRHQQIFVRQDYRAVSNGVAAEATVLDDSAMEFGQLYRSGAVLGTADDLPPARRPDEWAGQPGTRAPHLWLQQGGERVSSLDLLQRGWVLLSEDARWVDAAATVAAGWHFGLRAVQIDVDATAIEPGAFLMAFGLGPTGAVLVRPDGYIAWRLADAPAGVLLAPALAEALTQVASLA